MSSPTTNQMIREFDRIAKPTAQLIPMDRRLLEYLQQHGPCRASAIPARLFSGEIPAGLPNLPDLGFVEDAGDCIAITDAGRKALRRF